MVFIEIYCSGNVHLNANKIVCDREVVFSLDCDVLTIKEMNNKLSIGTPGSTFINNGTNYGVQSHVIINNSNIINSSIGPGNYVFQENNQETNQESEYLWDSPIVQGIIISGSAQVECDLDVSPNLSIDIQGNSGLDIRGTHSLNQLKINLVGNGNVFGNELEVSKLIINLTGNGYISDIMAIDQLFINCVGNGKIRVYCKPRCQINKSIVGPAVIWIN